MTDPLVRDLADDGIGVAVTLPGPGALDPGVLQVAGRLRSANVTSTAAKYCQMGPAGQQFEKAYVRDQRQTLLKEPPAEPWWIWAGWDRAAAVDGRGELPGRQTSPTGRPR